MTIDVKLTDYEYRLKAKNNWLTFWICVFAFAVILKIIGFILYARGIKAPRLIDILL